MNNGCQCPGHMTKAGLLWAVASPGGTRNAVVRPTGSRSTRRNSDVSPIAVLVDHENSIHTRPLCWRSSVRRIWQSQKSRFCHATPKVLMHSQTGKKNADCAYGHGYAQNPHSRCSEFESPDTFSMSLTENIKSKICGYMNWCPDMPRHEPHDLACFSHLLYSVA